FSSRRRHTRFSRDWSSDVCSSDLTISTNTPIAFDPYSENELTGGFILIDRISNKTLGAGTIDFGLRRGQNLTYQSFDVDRQVRKIGRASCRERVESGGAD